MSDLIWIDHRIMISQFNLMAVAVSDANNLLKSLETLVDFKKS